MSTIVQIQVNVDDARALSALTNIDAMCKSLSSSPVTIKIDAGAVDKVSKSVIQLARQQSKQATASANRPLQRSNYKPRRKKQSRLRTIWPRSRKRRRSLPIDLRQIR